MNDMLPLLAAALAALAVPPAGPAWQTTARGTVFVDRDRDGRRSADEPGLPGVRVSNGRQVVRTDAEGRYALAVDGDDIVFVIKPRGFMVATDADLVPRFHYVHKPAGSPPLKYGGVPPTGPLPDSIDFPLIPQDEAERLSVVVFGDPQPRNLTEVDWIGHDVLDRIEPGGASLALALGDIAFDDLRTFAPLCASFGRLGVPTFYVHGNHDMDYDAAHDDLADETWERVFGPANYAFDWGPVHFVVLDNVVWHPADPDAGRPRGGYTGRFDEEALGFLRADLAEVPRGQPVVVAFHIHLDGVENRAEFLDVLGDRPRTLSLSAHTHVHRLLFFGAEDGFRGPGEHLHVNHGTLCGSWFQGQPDERGIPHATMADGTPNGHGILEFDGERFAHRYLGAGVPAGEQMRIHAPAAVTAGEAVEVVVNVFGGSARSEVAMRIAAADGARWIGLQRVERTDPLLQAAWEAEQAAGEVGWRKLPKPQTCTHLWAGPLPADLPPGAHRIEVRSVDLFGRTCRAVRTIRIVAPGGGR